MNITKIPRILFHSLSSKPKTPYHVQWMLTRKCNFRCKGCNVWRTQDEKELSTEEIKEGMNQLKRMGVIDLVLSGGNPLLREDIDEIIEYASHYFITTVYDNGSIALKKIEALRKADFVAISIDSLSPQKNDYIKGVKGAWKTSMRTVKKLQEEKVSVCVTPTISQINLHEIPHLTRYFLARGIPLWYSLYSYDFLEGQNQLFRIGEKKDEYIITDKEAMVALCNFLLELKQKNANVLITTKILEAIRDVYLKGKRTWKCQALKTFFMIDPTGKVAGCHLYEPVTSIFDLNNVWDTETLNRLRGMYEKCERCMYLCYISYSLHGTVRGNLQLAKDRWRSWQTLIK